MLCYKELPTYLHQIKAVLNSKPLCSMTRNLKDLNVLIPGHFLIGDLLHHRNQTYSTSHPDFYQNGNNECFWKRRHNEYLFNMQQRPNWLLQNRNISNNALVLIKGTTPGPDNIVRVASVKTVSGAIVRSIGNNYAYCLLTIPMNIFYSIML